MSPRERDMRRDRQIGDAMSSACSVARVAAGMFYACAVAARLHGAEGMAFAHLILAVWMFAVRGGLSEAPEGSSELPVAHVR